MDHNRPTAHDLIDEDEGSPAWVMVYADLMTLLLTFFILLFMFSTINVDKFKKVVTSLQENLGDRTSTSGVLHPAGDPHSRPQPVQTEPSTALQALELMREMHTFIQIRSLGPMIDVQLEESSVIVRMKDQAFFASGSGTLNPDANTILSDITKVFERFPEYMINIKGHTDNVPISTAQFPSNWELSAIRATTVLKHLLDKGVSPRRVTATGFADSMPLGPNDTEAQRSKNRRVEFVLEKATP